MRAIVYDGFGPLSVIQERAVAPPELKAGQVRIKVRASGVNRADIAQRLGKYPPPPGESDIPGLEVSGVVAALGPGAKRYKEGDLVTALLAGGGYADEACVDERLVMPCPKRLSLSQAAAVPEAFITAHLNLFQIAGLKSGDKALVHAGASGVGTSTLQLLRARGIEAFATAGGREKADMCRALGARAIEHKKEGFAKIVLEATGGRGVDAILDPVGTSNFDADLECLAPGGRLIVIGTMGGKDVTVDLAQLLRKRHRLIGSSLRGLPLDDKAAAVARFSEDFAKDLDAGTVAPVIDSVIPASQAALAQERMEKNLNAGKLVLAWT